MAASDTGQFKAVKVLLDRGADINAEDIHGRTALFQASKYGDTRVVNFLKAHGAKE
jgi:ankyrin repeat protein